MYCPAKQILAAHPANGRRFCVQCGREKPWPSAFVGLRGAPIARCTKCSQEQSERQKKRGAHPKRKARQ